MIDVKALEEQMTQLRDTAGLLRSQMARLEEQRRQSLDAIDRAYAAGAEAMRKALLVEFAGNAQAEAIIRRASPDSR